MVVFEVIGAKDLPHTDVGLFECFGSNSAEPDPFMTARLLDGSAAEDGKCVLKSGSKVRRSTYLTNAANPAMGWYVDMSVVGQEETDVVALAVWDYDAISFNDLIGICFFQPSKLGGGEEKRFKIILAEELEKAGALRNTLSVAAQKTGTSRAEDTGILRRCASTESRVPQSAQPRWRCRCEILGAARVFLRLRGLSSLPGGVAWKGGKGSHNWVRAIKIRTQVLGLVPLKSDRCRHAGKHGSGGCRESQTQAHPHGAAGSAGPSPGPTRRAAPCGWAWLCDSREDHVVYVSARSEHLESGASEFKSGELPPPGANIPNSVRCFG